MSHDRNIKWLNDRHVIYRRDPVSGVPTVETAHYKYYENGTHECYHLFNSRAKITTYRSLKWHLYVLYYLNMDNIINSDFVTVARFIADKENGFVTFFISEKKLQDMISDVLMQGGDPPVNKKRKIIFKDYSGLTPNEKMSIVGKLIGRSRRINEEDIYECMLEIHFYFSKKITINNIASLLDCSARTIQRNMSDQLKKEKTILNLEL